MSFSLSEEELRRLRTRNPGKFAELYKQGLEAQIALARTNVNAFVEFILRDEKTQESVKQSPIHVRMHEFCDQNRYGVMWGSVESGRCVIAETVFWAEDGTPTTTDQLRAACARGERPRIWTLDPTTKAWRVVPVKTVFANGVKPCVRVTTAHGMEAVTSDNHPYLAGVAIPTEEGTRYHTYWREARNLTKQSYVFSPGTAPPVPTTNPIGPDEAFAVGYLFSLLRFHEHDVEDRHRGMEFRVPATTLAKAYAHARLGRLIAERQGWTYVEQEVGEVGAAFSLHAKAGPSVEEWLRARGVETTYEQATNWDVNHTYWTRVARSPGPWSLPGWVWHCSPAAARAFCKGYLLPGLGELSIRGGEDLVVARVPRYLSQGLLQALRRGGVVGALARASKDDRLSGTAHTRVHGAGGDWAAFVRELISLTGVAWLELEPLLPFVRDGEAFAMSPVRVRRVESVGHLETWGVEIDDPQHTHVTDGILTHNTQQITIARTLWRLGHDPTSRIVIVQSTATIARDTVMTLKQHIESNKNLRLVFPDLQPGDMWTNDTITVKRPPGIRTPSVQARGAMGKVLGHRYDLLLVDDAVTVETSRTAYMRNRLMEWFLKEPLSRLLNGGQALVLLNAFHPEDLGHTLVKRGWPGVRFPIRDPITKISVWPERWPQERIAEYERRSTVAEAQRALDCIARSDDDASFKDVWTQEALVRGRGLYEEALFAPYLPHHLDGKVHVATGVDLAFAKTQRADYTALFTAAFHPDGTVDILDIQRGKWASDEILARIVDARNRFGSTVYIESNAGQIAFADMLTAYDPTFPVYPFFTLGHGTRSNKYHAQFGIQRLAFEMSRGLWRFPCRGSDGAIADELREYITELSAYLPDEHPGDILAAAWMAVRGARDRGMFKYDHALVPNNEEQLGEERRLEALREQQDAAKDPEGYLRKQAERYLELAGQALWEGVPRE